MRYVDRLIRAGVKRNPYLLKLNYTDIPQVLFLIPRLIDTMAINFRYVTRCRRLSFEN